MSAHLLSFIVAARHLYYDPDTPCSSHTAAVCVLLLILGAEHYSVDVLRSARNVLARLPVDPAEDGRELSNLTMRAEHQFPVGSC